MMGMKLSRKKVTEFITELENAKDPAIVGLRRILRSKELQGNQYPLREHCLDDFECEVESGNKIFSDKEKRILELEKENLILLDQLESLKKECKESSFIQFKNGVAEGEQRGQKDGYAQAKVAFEKDICQIKDKIEIILRNFVESRTNLFINSEKLILDIATNIARNVIHTELTLNNDVIISVIRHSIKHIVDRQKFMVRVAPNDLETVTKGQEFWTSISERFDNVDIESDERITSGGCIIESVTGVVDARIDVQFGEMMKTIDDFWDSMVTVAQNAIIEPTNEKVFFASGEDVKVVGSSNEQLQE